MLLACPMCGVAIHASAIVSAFNEPDGWDFWGEAGQRWIVCQRAKNGKIHEMIHFRVIVGGRDNHRLAMIK